MPVVVTALAVVSAVAVDRRIHISIDPQCLESGCEFDEMAARITTLRDALLAILYASDQCVGHRACGHSMQPWKNARRLLGAETEEGA